MDDYKPAITVPPGLEPVVSGITTRAPELEAPKEQPRPVPRKTTPKAPPAGANAPTPLPPAATGPDDPGPDAGGTAAAQPVPDAPKDEAAAA